MEISVRFASGDDAPAIYAFVQALAAHERQPERIACTAADLEAQLRAAVPPFECLIAEIESAAVGIALFHYAFSTWRGRPAIFVEDLFVAERHRRRHVAKRLLVELARAALQRGGACLEWRCADWDDAATAFSQDVGAAPLRPWTTYRMSIHAVQTLARVPAPGSSEVVLADPQLVSDHPMLGSEFTWVCSDENGQIAAFCINREGPVPAKALDDPALMDRTYDAIDGLAPCGGVELLADAVSDRYYSERLAERGIYAFDWDATTRTYILTARPTASRRIDDLRTAEDRKGASVIVLSSSLGEQMEFSVAALETALRSVPSAVTG